MRRIGLILGILLITGATYAQQTNNGGQGNKINPITQIHTTLPAKFLNKPFTPEQEFQAYQFSAWDRLTWASLQSEYVKKSFGWTFMVLGGATALTSLIGAASTSDENTQSLDYIFAGVGALCAGLSLIPLLYQTPFEIIEKKNENHEISPMQGMDELANYYKNQRIVWGAISIIGGISYYVMGFALSGNNRGPEAYTDPGTPQLVGLIGGSFLTAVGISFLAIPTPVENFDIRFKVTFGDMSTALPSDNM